MRADLPRTGGLFVGQHTPATTPTEDRLEGIDVSDTTFHVYDTTLRDGAQQEGMNLSVADKLAIAPLLDELGVGFIEGGWPGAIPKDTEFFQVAAKELELTNAVLAAFGATRKAGGRAYDDPQVRALLDSAAPVITLVAKSDIRHVERALRTTGEENLRMIDDTVRHLVSEGRRVVVDMEHFFDGFRFDNSYGLQCVETAFAAGAEVVCLCDTNGGMLPGWVHDIVSTVRARSNGILGMHAHNDSGCAVANTLAAVDAGARHVQGCVNGYGERTGNADLIAVVANLALKMGHDLLLNDGLANATRLSYAIAELTTISPFARQPYVGSSAFAHKAGLHASAIRVDPDLYQHIDPALVGNDMRMLISEMAGRASVELKGRELGIDVSDQPDLLQRVTDRVKEAEANGYTYDAADASFELLLRGEAEGKPVSFFDVDSWRVLVEARSSAPHEAEAEATVRLNLAGRRIIETAEGNGPVNALDCALRKALRLRFPQIDNFELIDYKVRILDTESGTDAVTRVLIETMDLTGECTWRTVGVGPNVIEASWEALVDSFNYGLLKAGVLQAA